MVRPPHVGVVTAIDPPVLMALSLPFLRFHYVMKGACDAAKTDVCIARELSAWSSADQRGRLIAALAFKKGPVFSGRRCPALSHAPSSQLTPKALQRLLFPASTDLGTRHASEPAGARPTSEMARYLLKDY